MFFYGELLEFGELFFVTIKKSCIFASFFEQKGMNYLLFRERWLPIGCFNIYQVRAWNGNFDRTNLTRWQKQGFLCRLRQDWYAFSELMATPMMANYIASKIYTPSYISLQAALSMYGIIPEAVTDITCVTTNRTTAYDNAFGHYTYQTIRPPLFFGYRQMPLERGGCYQMAEPEKALVDLMYLYPQYNTEAEMCELRLDNWWMAEQLDKGKLRHYAALTGVKALANRAELMINTYCND